MAKRRRSGLEGVATVTFTGTDGSRVRVLNPAVANRQVVAAVSDVLTGKKSLKTLRSELEGKVAARGGRTTSGGRATKSPKRSGPSAYTMAKMFNGALKSNKKGVAERAEMALISMVQNKNPLAKQINIKACDGEEGTDKKGNKKGPLPTLCKLMDTM